MAWSWIHNLDFRLTLPLLTLWEHWTHNRFHCHKRWTSLHKTRLDERQDRALTSEIKPSSRVAQGTATWPILAKLRLSRFSNLTHLFVFSRLIINTGGIHMEKHYIQCEILTTLRHFESNLICISLFLLFSFFLFPFTQWIKLGEPHHISTPFLVSVCTVFSLLQQRRLRQHLNTTQKMEMSILSRNIVI